MKLVTVTWDADSSTFIARGANPAFGVTMAGPRKRQPDGSRQSLTAMSPTETMLAGIGGCTAWDVVEILRKQRQPVHGVQALVEGDQAEAAPWPFTRIRVTFVVRGRGIPLHAVERAVQLSMEKYCSAIATVRGVATVETAIELVDVDGTDGVNGAAPAR